MKKVMLSGLTLLSVLLISLRDLLASQKAHLGEK